MKKIILIFIIFLFNLNNVFSLEKTRVEFNACVDGDTAKFIYNDEIITARFLAIDTPETKHPTKDTEPYGKEASDFTCNKLKKAREIILEFDKNSDIKDKYNRYLVWVFTDNNLLQKDIVYNGLADVKYLYGDYKYTYILEDALDDAKLNKRGMWDIENKKYNNTDYFIVSLILIIIIYIFNKKFKKN